LGYRDPTGPEAMAAEGHMHGQRQRRVGRGGHWGHVNAGVPIRTEGCCRRVAGFNGFGVVVLKQPLGGLSECGHGDGAPWARSSDARPHRGCWCGRTATRSRCSWHWRERSQGMGRGSPLAPGWAQSSLPESCLPPAPRRWPALMCALFLHPVPRLSSVARGCEGETLPAE